MVLAGKVDFCKKSLLLRNKNISLVNPMLILFLSDRAHFTLLETLLSPFLTKMSLRWFWHGALDIYKY